MDDIEGQIEAFDLGQRTLADQIKELEGSEQIDEDLRALKARVGGANTGGTQGN
jgi:phage shock protein A